MESDRQSTTAAQGVRAATENKQMTEAGRPKGRRRSQAERSAETRSTVIDAAIQCLFEVGYAATTTSMVVERAGVSRGAMTHQFPSKVDLMEAVVATVYDREIEDYEALSGGGRSRQAFFDFPRRTWTVLSRPPAVAVTEIMMASRSDPAMAERLRDQQSRIDENARKRVEAFRNESGVAASPLGGPAIHRLVVAAARGLSIEALYSQDDESIDQAVDLLCQIMTLLYPPSDGD
ncbi:MAG: TetR/AcrR family transcriptional regulator [Phenylobacterium sp.]|uniref:TetR/AcrR family transcriptional regulator n=1 Tax=Phenylobacterium sp. TaxID=1871053 RepID=UPI0025E79BB2|nr:TetR/AcrR family transcriptional regulator [Phenylobacterium sp.]MBA4013269.1 TetR/AcrR family transcriptional regulator [Phenylobacterium sp.]